MTRTNGVAERDPWWSPDGQWIAYFSDETGEYQLYTRWNGSAGGSDSVYAVIVELSDGRGGSIPDWYRYSHGGNSDFASDPWQGVAGWELTNASGGNEPVGQVTSGTMTPSLKKAVGMAYVPVEMSRPGTEIAIDVRGRRVPARIVTLPFYKRS